MKVVARRTGLSPHLIRIWERRYEAVTPCRSASNRRLYSDAEIGRLLLLVQATQAGHSIGHIAKLTEDEIRTLMQQDADRTGPLGVPARTKAEPARHPSRDPVADALAAIKDFDGQELERVLNQATAELGQFAVLHQAIVPLVHRIGELWQEGGLKVAHEHIATAILRTFLGNLGRAYTLQGCAPRLLVTTPPGQVHELGAMLTAVTASHLGWRVTYLGPCVPAEEVAGAAIQNASRAVALSLVYPEDDPYLGAELARLRQMLPAEVAILIGGRAAPAYNQVLESIGSIPLRNLGELQLRLDALRKAGCALKPAPVS